MNIVDVESDGSSLLLFGAEVPVTDDVRRDLTAAGAGTYAVGVRPEHLLAVAEGEGVITGEVVVVEELGSGAFVHIRVEGDGDEQRELVVRAPCETSISRGDRVSVAFDGPTHVFDADGGRLGD
jgi:multiple sugar transport system ATP-binding protein